MIAICRMTGDKWQSKTLILANFDPRSWIVKSVFDCRLSGVIKIPDCRDIPSLQLERVSTDLSNQSLWLAGWSVDSPGEQNINHYPILIQPH